MDRSLFIGIGDNLILPEVEFLQIGAVVPQLVAT